VRRREFAIGLLLAATMQPARAQEQAKQHRIAFVALGPVARIDDPGNPLFGAFFDELRQLGDVKGQNLTVDRYSGEERSKGFADLAREVVDSNPDVIVALGNAIALAARAANGTIPIVWIGADPIEAGLGASLARPGGNITGVTVYPGAEIWGKRLQILKEAVPWMSKVAYLDIRSQLSAAGQEERRKSEPEIANLADRYAA
jgi:putative tryptophan/tyrosine transport system substrate-binding protein